MAADESPRTTRLYDPAGDEIMLGEVERIGIWPRSSIRAGYGDANDCAAPK